MQAPEFDFEQAKTKHLLFKSRLRSIVFGEVIAEEESVLSQYECPVGIWIYNVAFKNYIHIPEIFQLEKVHAEIHETARELVALYKQGKVTEARNGLVKMEAIAEGLVNLLNSVEDQVKLSHGETTHTSPLRPADENEVMLKELLKKNEELDRSIRLHAEELQKQDSFFKNMMAVSPVAMWMTDTSGKLVYLNKTGFDWTGFTSEEIENDEWKNSIHFDDKERVEAQFRKSFEGRLKYDIEYRFVHKSGYTRWCYETGQPCASPSGEFIGFTGTITDVSEKKIAEAIIHEKTENERQMLHNFFMQAPAMICILRGPDHVFELTNSGYKNLIGNRDVIGLDVRTAMPEVEGQGFFEILDNVYTRQEVFVGNEMPITIDKGSGPENCYLNFIYQPIIDKTGQTDGILVFAHEVTEEVTARRQIEDSERRFRSLIEEAPIPMGLFVGQQMKIEVVNEALLATWGRDVTVIGKLLIEALPEMEGQPFLKLLDDVYTTGIPYTVRSIESKVARTGVLGTYYYDLWYNPLKNIDGQVYGILATGVDVTDKVMAHNKLEESESRFRNMVQQASVAISLTVGPDFILETINAPMLLLIDRQEDILGKPLSSIMPELENQPILDILRNVYASGETFKGIEMPVKIKSGQNLVQRFYNISYIPMFEDSKVVSILHVAVDVTEQVISRRNIEISEARFRLMADAMPQFVWTSDAKGNLNYYNQEVYNFSGLNYDQIQKDGWLQIVHPDEREENIEKWMHAVITGTDFIFQHRFKNKDGAYRWQLSRAVPQKDKDGNIEQWIGTSTDIHEQKTFLEQLETMVAERTRDLRELNFQLEHTNQELKQFAYVASHDLQEPLRKIITFSNRLTDKYNEMPTGSMEYLHKINSSAQRMSLLINDLLVFSSTTKLSEGFIETDLNEILREALTDFDVEIQNKDAHIEIGLLPVIKAIPMQMTQLFHNLVSNALKFSKAGRRQVIEIYYEKIKGEDIKELVEVKAQWYYKIVFSDTGIGFDSKYANQIFSIFQRLHGRSEYAGTGIGLALCKRIVENHKGIIYADGKQNEGAIFYILLPL